MSQWKFNSKALLCTAKEPHLVSRRVFTPHTPSTARTFNQASSPPGGEAATLAQIPAQGYYSAKGCFGLVHQTPTLPRWHSLLTADKGRDQHFAFMGCNGCVDCF